MKMASAERVWVRDYVGISFLADQSVMSLTAISFEVQRLWSVWPLNNVQVTVLCPLQPRMFVCVCMWRNLPCLLYV